MTVYLWSCFPLPKLSQLLPSNISTSSFSSSSTSSSSSWWILILIAQLVSGAASAGVAPFLLSYVDDFSAKNDAAFYVGVLFAISLIGPAFGYLLGAATIKVHIDFYR